MADDAEGSVDPSDAFDLVADETRVAIVRAVWDLTEHPGESVSFATLREEAGVRDSGQFNYHLDKLTPQFVRKVEAGYRLTEAGRRVVGAVVSGVYTDLDVALDVEPSGECPSCAGTLDMRYENGVLLVECADCDRHVMDMSTPPVLVAEADPDELPSVLVRHSQTELQRLNGGFCLYCGGLLTVETEPCEDGDLLVEFHCDACDKRFRVTVLATVMDHPAVVSLLHDAGFDVRETPLWELDAHLDVTEDVVASDPLRVEATLATDDGSVTLTLDDSLDVIDYERTDAGDGNRG